MPIMDGYESCTCIKKDPGNVNKSTPIFALTANVEEANEQKCVGLGMTG